MAGPNLPTNIVSGGTTNGHKNHSDTAHSYINKLDTTFLSPTDNHVLTYDSASGTYKPEVPLGGLNLESRLTALETPTRNAQTGTSYTVVAGDAGSLIEMNNASFNTVTLPTMTAGTTLGILQYGTGVTTIQGSGVTLRSEGGATALAGQFAMASVYYRTSTEVLLGGNLKVLSPSDVANLALWFRASDLVLLADGTAINGNWSSTVGTSSATQATGANQPTKQTATKPVVRFDGSNDKLVLDGDALTCTQNVGGVTVFVRMKLIAAPGSTGGIVGFSVGTGTGARTAMRATGGAWQIGGRRLDADSFVGVGTTSYETTSVHTLCGVINYASSDAFMFVDGAAAGTDTGFLTAGTTSNTASQTARLGSATDDTNPTNMDLYELLVYKAALSTGDRQLVEAYLAGV